MSFYSTLRNILSKKNQGRLSRVLIRTGLKPSVNKTAQALPKGVVVFSADFEMAWAYRYSKNLSLKAVEWGLKERKNLPVILKLFDHFNIPITWATVGHLFLRACKRDIPGKPHPDMPRPEYFENRNWIFNTGDWYSHDPCTDVTKDPAWYAPDLIEKILSSETGHEIGCHTFSHVDFTYKNCTKELADAELDACIKLSEHFGVKLRSMVFPGGTLGNFESLKEKEIMCYRMPMKYHLDRPYLDNYGLVAIPSSLGLDKDPYGWSKEFHLKMIRNFLEKATKHRLVCHFWFHPSMNVWYLKNVMPEVVKMVAAYRDAYKIKIATMSQLAEDFIKIKNKT